MPKKKQDNGPDKGFPEKYNKVLKGVPEFVDSANSMSTEELKQTIVTCEGHINVIENNKDSDPKVNAAKELTKEFSKSFNEAKKLQVAKIKYSLYLLEGRGVDIGSEEPED